MKPVKRPFKFWLSLTPALLLSGCVALPQPPAPPETTAPAAAPAEKVKIDVKPRIVHTVIPTEEEDSCGSLQEFVIDAQKLTQKDRKTLLDKLSQTEGEQFSCDKLKTGLLLSQIGKTPKEDSLAIEILQKYQDTDELKEDNQQLVQLLLYQSQERKRLHLLLNNLGEQLVTQKSLNTTMSDNLLALQQKIDQLQKLETDINETEQSIATPSTSSLDTATEENPGS